MAPRNSLFKAALVKKVMGDEFRRKKQAKQRSCVLSVFLQIASKRKSILLSLFHMILLLTNQNMSMPRPIRSERRLPRLQGWWDTVVRHYDDNRFKKNFRVTRATFLFLLDAIKIDLQKEVVTELPITPEVRLAVCLYRLGRGDYLHTISELTGLGTSTVCEIVVDVCKTIVDRLWDSCVAKHMPTDLVKLKESMVSFEELWQFPCCFGTVDGCHIPMKCPRGGQESAKEYHNFKNFFSLVIMAMVDAKKRFIWASAGFPGNSHDAIIFQSTKIFKQLSENNLIPEVSKNQEGTKIYPMILGDSAFPFSTWLMKPYSNAVLTSQQRYFNYRLSRARMVVECAFGQLKGRWRILGRKNESHQDTIKTMSLACIVLHNLCIDVSDQGRLAWDVTYDPVTNKKRPREVIQDMLHMTRCKKVADNSRNAAIIRDCLKNKFWGEKQGKGVN